MARSRKSIHIDKGVKIYLRPNSPCWQIQIWKGGHRSRASLDTTDVEAAKAMARHQADQAHSGFTRDVAPYSELLRAYKTHAGNRNTKATQELNFANLERVVRFIKKKWIKTDRLLTNKDFSVAAIEAYIAYREKQGRKPETINREIRTLSIFFNTGRRRRMIRENPAAEVLRVPEYPKDFPKALNDGEARTLLGAARDDVPHHGRGKKGKGRSRSRYTPLHDLILFILNTGARLGEALFMEFDDVNLEAKTIHFRNKEEHKLKTRQQRTVRGNAVVMDMLRTRLIRRGDRRWLFATPQKDKPLDRKNMLRELRLAVSRSGLTKRVNFLILRHTALTALARAGAPPFVIKEVAGHATIRTTERYYLARVGGAEWIPPSLGG